MELEKVQKEGGDEKALRTIPQSLRNDAGPFSGLQLNALVSLVHLLLLHNKAIWTRDASALRWRPERGPESLGSGVGFLTLSHPHVFLYFFQLNPYWK